MNGKVNVEDIFNRAETIKSLTKLLDSRTDGVVMSISANWGVGKTSFIKIWEDYLALNSDDSKSIYDTIYYNAWENDDVEDPMLAILSVLQSKYSSMDRIDEGIKNVTRKIIENAGPMLLRVLSNKMLGEESSKLLEELFTGTVDKALSTVTDKLTIKAEINKLLEEITGESGKKLLVFIDDLDRCRPDYAVLVLEKVKHFFGKNCHFVIAVDFKQLERYISKVYGICERENDYLRKFIDIEFFLPEPDNYKYIEFLSTVKPIPVRSKEFMCGVLYYWSTLYGCTLRDIDRAYSFLSILMPNAISVKLQNDYIEEDLRIAIYAFFSVWQLKDKSNFSNFLNAKGNPQIWSGGSPGTQKHLSPELSGVIWQLCSDIVSDRDSMVNKSDFSIPDANYNQALKIPRRCLYNKDGGLIVRDVLNFTKGFRID